MTLRQRLLTGFSRAVQQALTDETARANLEKHGHPDGPQGVCDTNSRHCPGRLATT